MTTARNIRGGFHVRHWPLRTHFVLLVALFIAAAASAAWYVEVQTDRDGRRAAVTDARFASRTAGKQLGDYVMLVRATAERLAANPQITQVFVNPAACSLTFAGLAGTDSSHLDILRPDGSVACSSRRTEGQRPPGYRSTDWLRAASSTPVLVAPRRDGATGAQVAIISAPIPGSKGVVAGFVDLSAVGPHLASLFGGGHPVEFLVTSKDGHTVIARSIDPKRWVGASLGGTGFSHDTNSVERQDLDGTTRLYARSVVPIVGWQFYVGEEKSAALAAADHLKGRQLAIIVAGLAALLLAVWLVYRNLAAPIRRLSHAVRPTGSAQTQPHVSVSGPAEVAALSGHVNSLIASVNDELQQRREAEARARAVLEAALDAVITIDHEGRILEFNPAAEAIFGYEREAVLGLQMAELLIPPSLRQDHYRGFEKYLTSGEGKIIGKRVEASAIRADGSEFPIEIAISRVVTDGAPMFTGYVRDISEQKRSEGQVRQLAAIVESSVDAIVGRGLDGVVTSWNAGAERLFGYSADEMIGKSVALLQPEGEAELEAINESLKTGVVEFETIRVRKDRSEIEVASTVSPIADASGRIVGAASISRGIGERKRAEVALRKSEARYRDLFENATDLIATVDLEARLTAVNEAFVRALGYTRGELLGRPLHELVPVEWHDQLERAREGKVDDEVESTIYEHELIAKDGHRIQVEVASRVIEEDGSPIGIEAICRDLSERKQLEEQLRQAQRLEAIGRLAGGVAHDFNNLLTVIGGYTEELLAQGDPRFEFELKEIAAASERATILTRQLLAFSRRQLLQPRVINLNEVVDGIMPMLTRLIGEDIELVAALDPSLDSVLADPNQIEQVLLNLVINARDAMPQGGKLTIETGNAELDETYAADHIEARVGAHATLAVSDNGVGMDSETAARVFEPFFTTKAVGTGTGLGLSTVYGIVKQSGGNVWVYSEPGKGSTFKVYLPAAASGSVVVDKAVQKDVKAATGTETLLVVEDEASLRELAAGILQKRGYTVLATSSSVEALRLAEQHSARIDLLLTDLVMPEMNGPDLAEKITALIPGVGVLYMSGYADEAVTRNGILKTGTPYLEKPFSASELAQKVRDALDRRASAPGWRQVA